MLDWLLDLYRPHVERVVLVVHPSVEHDVRAHGMTTGVALDYVTQPSSTGMLDAIMLARDQVQATDPSHVWITWCDQVALHPRTVAKLAALTQEHPDVPLLLPTAVRDDPYVHLARDGSGRIVRVLHSREGDSMPPRGESDAGLFSLTREAYLTHLPAFAATADAGGSTGERNFLPFIPWLAQRAAVMTFPCMDPVEAIGVNTPSELQLIADHLAKRGRGPT
jgi:bifunctional N-acetylglucosamine-1-phosphate-uridyltransferase/glucosamine-1-phosphate-acetyltransferase GlmU-like protein